MPSNRKFSQHYCYLMVLTNIHFENWKTRFLQDCAMFTEEENIISCKITVYNLSVLTWKEKYDVSSLLKNQPYWIKAPFLLFHLVFITFSQYLFPNTITLGVRTSTERLGERGPNLLQSSRSQVLQVVWEPCTIFKSFQNLNRTAVRKPFGTRNLNH